MGLLLNAIMRWMSEREKTLGVALGAVLLTVGIARAARLDVIVSTVTLGVTLANIAPRRSGEIFSLVRGFSKPIYVLFCVLVGARFMVEEVPLWLWVLVGAYILFFVAGKAAGSFIGASIAGAPVRFRRFLGAGLFAQGGVAVGLAVMAGQYLGGVTIHGGISLGDMIILSVTASTLVLQIAGPPMVRLAIRLAGEIGRDVTPDDVIADWTVGDAMDRGAVFIPEDEPLSGVIRTFSEHEAMSYPVVDDAGRLVGVVSLEGLKEALASRDTWEWLVAEDVALPVERKVHPSTPLGEAFSMMRSLKMERMPVVKGPEDDTAVGILDIHRAMWKVHGEAIRRQRSTPRSHGR
jgi:CBS domain-containing protein